MNNRIDWNLIINYLNGELSVEAEKNLFEWVNSSRKNKQEFELLKKIWNSPTVNMPKPDIEGALKIVKERIANISYSKENQESRIFKFRHKFYKSEFLALWTASRFVKIAALVLIIALGAFLTIKFLSNSPMEEVLVDNKLIKNVTLPDGTKVKLDSGSLLKIAAKYGKNNRNVFLNGEGYFEVSRSEHNPFTIQTKSSKVTVLGTQFNVRAWDTNEKIAVAVAEGKVLFESENSVDEKNKEILLKGQMSFLDKSGVIYTPVNTDINEQISWINREMSFHSTPLGEVLDQLRRWYDVEFSLPDKSFKSERITIFIENKPIENILELISVIMNFEYERSGDKITFVSKE